MKRQKVTRTNKKPSGNSKYGKKRRLQMRGIFEDNSPLPAYKRRSVMLPTGKSIKMKVLA